MLINDHFDQHEQTDSSPELQGREGRSWEVRAPLVDTIKFWCASCASPAGQAWQERNGIDRSRPGIGTWVSPAARGPLLHSLSDQYKYTAPCSPSPPAQVPCQAARIRGRACVRLPRDVRQHVRQHDGDEYTDTNDIISLPVPWTQALGKGRSDNGQALFTTTLKVLRYEAGTEDGEQGRSLWVWRSTLSHSLTPVSLTHSHPELILPLMRTQLIAVQLMPLVEVRSPPGRQRGSEGLGSSSGDDQVDHDRPGRPHLRHAILPPGHP